MIESMNDTAGVSERDKALRREAEEILYLPHDTVFPPRLDVQPYLEMRPGNCAAATMKMLLAFWKRPGHEQDEGQVDAVLENGEAGVTNEIFLREARSTFGFDYDAHEHMRLRDILHFLEEGIPVVVDWTAAYVEDGVPVGHYSIVVELSSTHITLMDPAKAGERTLTHADFLSAWYDFPGLYLTRSAPVQKQFAVALYPRGRFGS